MPKINKRIAVTAPISNNGNTMYIFINSGGRSRGPITVRSKITFAKIVPILRKINRALFAIIFAPLNHFHNTDF